MAMLRMLGRDLHSTYGPTADTGGLIRITPRRSTPTSLEALLEARARVARIPLPGEPLAHGMAVTERP